jgi:predicted SAM-dependent methyltransferase
MKLHLGCGTRYFEGYENIDYPPSEHTVQKDLVADKFCNILELEYSAGSIDEIRLHHVFEHFARPVTCALLSNWYMWLKPGGILDIEVPDFERTAKVALGRFTKPKQRFVALRHIFGSHEAHWAVHYEGYSNKLMTQLLSNFGFKIIEYKKNEHNGTYNMEVIAFKENTSLTWDDLIKTSESWLSNYKVDEADSERSMHAIWMEEYRKVINKKT